jgi:hypothetical protein
LVGIDIDHASKFIDLSRLEAVALPLMGFNFVGVIPSEYESLEIPSNASSDKVIVS